MKQLTVADHVMEDKAGRESRNEEVEMEEQIRPVWASLLQTPRRSRLTKSQQRLVTLGESQNWHAQPEPALSATHATAKNGSFRGDSGVDMICISPMEKLSGDVPVVSLRVDGLCLTGIPQDVAARTV